MYFNEPNGGLRITWIDTEDVIALPYDIPIRIRSKQCKYSPSVVCTCCDEFNLQYFNDGDYIGACQDKISSENISKVLYPNDNNVSGKS
jgi:starch phosphorylase